MEGEILAERRRWFRVFPEGTLEFLIITRVLGLLFLLALAIVGGTQRPLVLIGLACILWADYALLLWWAVQVATDLRMVSGEADGDDLRQRGIRAAVIALLPSVAAVMALAPWSGLLAVFGSELAWSGVLPAVGGVAFVLLLWPAYRALRGIRLGSAAWTLLFLVPVINYFALHRIACGMDAEIRESLERRGEEARRLPSAAAALTVADITWVLSVLPWAIVVAIVLWRGWPTGGAFKLGPVCGTMLAAVFAVANLAAMESVQRKIVALIRRS